jgi:hypothetical protein
LSARRQVDMQNMKDPFFCQLNLNCEMRGINGATAGAAFV